MAAERLCFFLEEIQGKTANFARLSSSPCRNSSDVSDVSQASVPDPRCWRGALFLSLWEEELAGTGLCQAQETSICMDHSAFTSGHESVFIVKVS